MSIPKKCPSVPSVLLNPRETWANKDDYDSKAKMVNQLFDDNYKKIKIE